MSCVRYAIYYKRGWRSNTNPLYINMNTKINSLARFRKGKNVSVHDMAYLLESDPSNLVKVEKGYRNPNPRTILAYNILFDADLKDLFHDQYRTLKNELLGQSRKLLPRLENEHASKSKNRLSFFSDIVNSLNNELL